MKFSHYIILILLLVFSLVACTDLEDYTGEEHSVLDIPGTVRLELPLEWEIGEVGGTWHGTFSQEPTSFNPFASLDDSHAVVTDHILDKLFHYNKAEAEWQGHMIESWNTVVLEESGEMELICNLRQDIFWNDGVQMTVYDIVFCYDQLEGNPDLNPRNYQGQFMTMDDGSEVRILVEEIDAFTYKYIFPRPVPNPLLLVNTNSVVPKHIWEPVVEEGLDAIRAFWNIETEPDELVGNGSYILESFKQGERMIYRRSPRFWKKDEKGNNLPYVEREVYTFIPPTNPTADLLMFQRGETDSYILRGQDLATLLPETEEKAYSIWNGGPSTGYPFLTFNMNPAAIDEELSQLFSDRHFRYAISCLVPRQSIIDQAINGLAEPQYHYFGPNNKYYNPAYATPYRYNPDQAAELLAEAGLTDSDGDGTLELPSGKALQFSMVIYNQDPILQDYLNMIIAEMNEAGIEVTLEVVDFNQWVQKILNTFEWECTFYSNSFPTFPEQWQNVWKSSGNLHYWYPKQEEPITQWEARVDELYDQMLYAYEEEQMMALYDEFQKILMEELPMIPIFNKYSFMAIYDKWGNVNWDNRHNLGDDGYRIYLKDLE